MSITAFGRLSNTGSQQPSNQNPRLDTFREEIVFVEAII